MGARKPGRRSEDLSFPTSRFIALTSIESPHFFEKLRSVHFRDELAQLMRHSGISLASRPNANRVSLRSFSDN